jgi:hypothetical protein
MQNDVETNESLVRGFLAAAAAGDNDTMTREEVESNKNYSIILANTGRIAR